MKRNPPLSEFDFAPFVTSAIVTTHTCGPRCWQAIQDECRCECGGRNHGCLRTESGINPTRRTKFKSDGYSLIGVGRYDDMSIESERIKSIEPCETKTQMATPTQISNWPELTAYRQAGSFQPYLLWKRENIFQSDQKT